MRRLLVPCLFAGLVASGATRAADPELKTEDDKTLYAIGQFVATRFQISQFSLTPQELQILQQGIADAATGKPAKVDFTTYLDKMKDLSQKRVAAWSAATAVAERKKGKEFLDTIAAKPGIKKTGTGLLMETIAEGKGASPTDSDVVKVNYKGTTIDGNEFDGSEKHGAGPSTMSMTQLVKCWVEALEFMKPGGKAKIYCPADLAYGDAGRGPGIPPGATLIFDLELVEIVKPAADAPKKN